ncbi:dynein regulatory complex protein 9 isoform X4 [Pezoporus flaviventris]|uniref:dynein regulatory complex protein 9 isoform X4 n=1 Tax=Pezoporus flaviventris TaxID=889875 RepID=UPI002AAFE379|nr:dynein regulatory complex protein 9 isoform X4 [Pezoporus flaviventris]
MEKLTHLEALLFTDVLETCVDQLSILGYIMPVSYEGQKTDLGHSGIQEMKEIVEALKELDSNYQESANQGSRETITSMSLKSIEHKQQLGKTEELKSTHLLSNRAVKNSALSIESLRKIQADRQYASDVITATMKRMQESGTFNSLTEANEREEAKKSKFHDVLIREQEGKKQIKSLEKQLQYVKKQTETELKKLKSKTDEETRVHTEIEDFLRQNHKKVEEKLEFWVDKYENDTDAKDKELDALKALKANNLEILQGLAKECQTFEKTIITDRAEKDAKRKQIEQEALQLKSTLKLQSWWRGTMVRKNLGPYQGLKKKMEKKKSDHKEKGKKGKAGAKKKK